MEFSDPKLAKPYSPPPCLKSCFSSSVHHGHSVSDDEDAARDSRTPRSPYKWLKSTAAQEIPDIRFRCRSLMARLGRNGARRTYNSSDFSYDPSSYALNFDDAAFGRRSDGDGDESFPFRDFSARLPLSPKVASSGAVRKEIVGFSWEDKRKRDRTWIGSLLISSRFFLSSS